MTLKKLDEKGFVFITKNRPYWCCIYGNTPWFMYWNDGSWVTLREVNQTDIRLAKKMAIPEKEANIYHEQQKK